MMDNDLIEYDEETLESQFESGPDHANLKILPAYFFLIFFLAGFVLELFMGFNLFRWQVQLMFGTLFVGLATMLFALALNAMQEKGTPMSPDEATKVIVESGPYKFSRNPIYISFSLLYLGLVIAFDIVWGMILFVPLIYCIIKYVIEPEESYLGRKFRGDYEDYKSHVPRWLF